MKTSITLNHILKIYGFNDNMISATLLIRHNHVTNKNVYSAIEADDLERFQSIQEKNFFNGVKYLVSFIKVDKRTALLYGVYEYTGVSIPVNPVKFIGNAWWKEEYNSHMEYSLTKTKYLSDLKGRLFIEWNFSDWKQKATRDNFLISISAD